MAATVRLEEDELALVSIEGDALGAIVTSPSDPIHFVTFRIGQAAVEIRLSMGELGKLFRSYARAVDHFEKEMEDGLLVERNFV